MRHAEFDEKGTDRLGADQQVAGGEAYITFIVFVLILVHRETSVGLREQ